MGPVAKRWKSSSIWERTAAAFWGANSTTPWENPTIISNIVELISMMICRACVLTFGKMTMERRKERKAAAAASGTVAVAEKEPIFGRQGRSVLRPWQSSLWQACASAFQRKEPAIQDWRLLGLTRIWEAWKEKEVRFGVDQSALFTTVTTSFTTGTVNNMHDTLTPLGGLVPMLHMMLNVVFGGLGVGLMNMLMYAILTVFICGLMVGRTPEYLGKKIEGKEMKLVVLVLIVHPLLILGFSALAVCVPEGLAGITNPSFHGLSQVLYEYASSAANNGSGFEGLADNSYFWNITTGLAMFFGRYIAIIAQLAIAGSCFPKSASGNLGTSCARTM